jgi:hypothetical protein
VNRPFERISRVGWHFTSVRGNSSIMIINSFLFLETNCRVMQGIKLSSSMTRFQLEKKPTPRPLESIVRGPDFQLGDQLINDRICFVAKRKKRDNN